MVSLLLAFALAQDGLPEADAPAPAHHGLAGVACAHCHESPHGEGTSGCASCHGDAAWKPSLFTVARHAETRFPLEGRHVDASCGGCHIEGKLTGLPTSCADCHLDRHRGKLGEDCTACHSVQGFTPVEGFDHLARTGVPLTGHHGGLACASCHQGDNGRAMRLTMEPTCLTCHDAGHGAIGADCASCHTLEQAAWVDAARGFDHRVTSFPLERRHKPLDCADCHPVGMERVPRSDCQGCHTDVHAGQLGQVCGDCHAPDRWTVVRFDHDQAAWPLRGRHFVAPCVSCHTNQRWIGLRTDCWDCHAAEALQGPAAVPAHGQPGASCDDCHGTWSWRF